MKKLALIATVSLLASACGGAATPGPKSADSAKSKTTAHAKKKKADKPDATPAKTASRDARKVGDYFVQRFSGSFSKQPMTLTERVIAKKRQPGHDRLHARCRRAERTPTHQA